MACYNKEYNIKYDSYQFDKLLQNIDIIGSEYTIINTIRIADKKAVYLITDKNNKKLILKAKLKDFVKQDEIIIYKTIKKNPNKYVNKIIAIYETSKLVIVVSEYIDGIMYAQIKTLDILFDDALKIKKNVLVGLEHLHGLNIIHGDLTPYNIMISTKNNVYMPVIIDFDHSKLYNNNIDKIKIDDVCGTDGYIAPECFKGVISRKSDIWSLGKTYEGTTRNRFITNIILKMTQEDDDERPTGQDVINSINNYIIVQHPPI